MPKAPFQPYECKVNPKLCFMIMPFDPALKSVYDSVQKTIQERCGLICVRADQIARSDRITDDIWTHINEARLSIADLTGRNPNVFYELGLAHGCHRQAILLTQEQDDIPFDLNELRYIKYDPNDLTSLTEALPGYVRNYISTIPHDWKRNYRPSNWDGPYVKITFLEAPSAISLDEPFEIILKARNNGRVAAHQGHFSISFPGGVEHLKLETDADKRITTKIGREYQSWANERVVLAYPIAEGFKYDTERPAWPSGSEYFIKVSGYAKSRGFLWFYVNASCRDETSGQWAWDPEKPLLDIDQRDESVYCGIIDVT